MTEVGPESARRESGDLPPGRLRLASPYDTDARYGLEQGSWWTGYKVHISETCDEADDQGAAVEYGAVHGFNGPSPRIITNIATTHATVTDAEMIEPIQHMVATRDLLPAEHYLDSVWTAPASATSPRQKPWRARCVVGRTAGSASGTEKRTGGNTGTALRADSTRAREALLETLMRGPTIAWPGAMPGRLRAAGHGRRRRQSYARELEQHARCPPVPAGVQRLSRDRQPDEGRHGVRGGHAGAGLRRQDARPAGRPAFSRHGHGRRGTTVRRCR